MYNVYVRNCIKSLIFVKGNSGGNEEIAEDVVKNVPLGRTPCSWKTFDPLPTPSIVQAFINLLWMRVTFFKVKYCNRNSHFNQR